MTKMNRDELASAFGKSGPTIDAFVREGMPFLSRPNRGPTGGGRGQWEFDSSRCIEWYAGRNKQGKAKSAAREDMELRSMNADAVLKEVKAAEALKSVVRVEDVLDQFSEQYGIVKSRITALPGRLAVAAAAESDPVKVLALIKAEVDEALSEISGGDTGPVAEKRDHAGAVVETAPPEDPYDGY
jgi:phage terminase Nu1 subunit (DNA packaging protein)